MRFFLIFSLLLFSLKGAVTDIKKKISSTEQNITYVKTTISHMNHALDLIVQRIKKESFYLQNINNKIDKIKQQIEELQTQLSDKRVSLDKLETKKSKLLKEQKELEEELINFISNNFYLSNSDSVSMTDVINEEIVNSVTKESSKKIDKISSRCLTIEKEIEKINQLIEDIKKDKDVLEAREKELLELQEKKKKKIALLNQEKVIYRNNLNKILEYQKDLENKLSTLNVLQKRELDKQRKLAKELEEKLKRKKEKKSAKFKKVDKVAIKNYGNIYMKTRTARYRGEKGVIPLEGKIVKQFGAYKDPIYHINIYNDSITIKPSAVPGRVRVIMKGEVVFVGDTSEGKMIVIKHNRRLYSIYAKLDRISPFIKKGYNVKRGEVIAKVDKELEFEVTYKTLPINPKEVVNF